MNKETIKNLCIRALKVFIYTFVSSVIVQLASTNFIEYENVKDMFINTIISSGISGISAVWNMVLSPFLKTD